MSGSAGTPESEASEFANATSVEALGDGRWGAAVDPGWFGPPGPNGGVIAAMILRAIRAELADAERLPRSLTLHYLRPPVAGGVEIEVTVERSGRSASTCSARMIQDGKLTTIALCVLSHDYETVAEWAPVAPAAPPPEEVPLLSLSGVAPAMFERLETHGVFGPPPFTAGEEALTGGWLRTTGGDELDPELIAFFADAWWPAPFSRLEAPAMAPTLELTIHFRAKSQPGEQYALTRFWTEASIDGLFDEMGEVWDADGRLLAQSRQLALLRPWRAVG